MSCARQLRAAWRVLRTACSTGLSSDSWIARARQCYDEQRAASATIVCAIEARAASCLRATTSLLLGALQVQRSALRAARSSPCRRRRRRQRPRWPRCKTRCWRSRSRRSSAPPRRRMAAARARPAAARPAASSRRRRTRRGINDFDRQGQPVPRRLRGQRGGLAPAQRRHAVRALARRLLDRVAPVRSTSSRSQQLRTSPSLRKTARCCVILRRRPCRLLLRRLPRRRLLLLRRCVGCVGFCCRFSSCCCCCCWLGDVPRRSASGRARARGRARQAGSTRPGSGRAALPSGESR